VDIKALGFKPAGEQVRILPTVLLQGKTLKPWWKLGNEKKKEKSMALVLFYGTFLTNLT
jgi:hypothetical protein